MKRRNHSAKLLFTALSTGLLVNSVYAYDYQKVRASESLQVQISSVLESRDLSDREKLNEIQNSVLDLQEVEFVELEDIELARIGSGTTCGDYNL